MTEKSPLTFKLVSEPLEATITNSSSDFQQPVSVAAPIEIHLVQDQGQRVKRHQVEPSTAQSEPIKTFTLWVKSSASRYNHKTNIRRNPIHGPWPEAEMSDHDFTYFALKEVVPLSLAQHGLSDWTTGGQLSEDAKLARQEESSGGNWQIRDRIERRRKRGQATTDKDELTSWKSIWDALRSGPDAATERSASVDGSDEEKAIMVGEEPFDDGNGSEIISEPLRMNEWEGQGLDPFQNGKDSRSNESPEPVFQGNGGGFMAKSDNSHDLSKLLTRATSNKAGPRLHSPLEQGKDT